MLPIHLLTKNILTLSGLAFSVVRLAGGGGGGLTVPYTKNQGYYQPIEIKLWMGLYRHKSMPDAKFEPGSFSVFGDMMSQNFPLKKGTSH